MIEIILLITAALSATEIVSDDDAAAAATVTPAPAVATLDPAAELKADTPEAAPELMPVTGTDAETAKLDADDAATTAEQRRPDDTTLRRLAAEFVAEKDPDLDAAAKLGDTPERDASDAPMALTFVRSEIRYESQGHQIRMEVLRPDSDERRPAILILHGASGIGDGAFYRSAAEVFAERGYATFLPHYLAPGRANDPGAKKSAKRNAKTSAKSRPKAKDPTPNGSVRDGFDVQARILRDALEQIAQNPYVDDTRIGVFGMSLGGFHALNLSSRDTRVAAVVNMAGALRGNTMPASNHLAPTLALHGAKDNIVPVSRARSLGRYLKQHDIAHEVVIYNDQSHFFRGKAREDAFRRAANFFAGYLAVPTSSATVRLRAGTDQ